MGELGGGGGPLDDLGEGFGKERGLWRKEKRKRGGKKY